MKKNESALKTQSHESFHWTLIDAHASSALEEEISISTILMLRRRQEQFIERKTKKKKKKKETSFESEKKKMNENDCITNAFTTLAESAIVECKKYWF